MGKQLITSAIENGKRMGEYLQKGDIEGAKMLAAQMLGTNGPLFLEALMSKSLSKPDEIGRFFEKIAKLIESKKTSMERKIRKRMKQAMEDKKEAEEMAQKIAAEQMAKRQEQLDKAIKERNDLEKELREKEKRHEAEKKRLAEQRKRLEHERKKAAKARQKEIDEELKIIKKQEKGLKDEMKTLKANFEQKKKEVQERRAYLEKLKQKNNQQQDDVTQSASPRQNITMTEISQTNVIGGQSR